MPDLPSRHTPAAPARRFRALAWQMPLRGESAALAAERRLLAQVAQYTFNAVIVTDARRRTRWVNQAFTHITGYSAQEALGRYALELLRSSRIDGHEVERLRAAVDARRGYRGEVLARTKGGREIWADVEVQPLAGTTGFIVILCDVSERRSAADELARERLRMAHILEGTGAGDGEWNLQTGEVVMSPRWAAMFGWTVEELAPMSMDRWLGMLHPDDLGPATAELQRHLRGQEPQFRHEVRMRHRAGHWLAIDLRGRVSSRTPDGEPEWFSGTHIDVTPARHAARRWQARAELSADWFWLTDTQHRFVEMSVSGDSGVRVGVSRVLGRRRDELPWMDPPEPDDSWAPFHARLDRHEPFNGLVYRVGNGEGGLHWQEIDGRPRFDDDGRFAGYEGVGRDVTERRRIADEQKATQRALAEAKEVAEAANRAKSAFLATMSHEIRTPMNGVLGMAELLAHSALDGEQAQTVQTIRESATALLRLIDDILDFSKIEAGRLELEHEPLLLTPLVEGVCEALAALAVDKGVALHQFIDPRTPESLVADDVRLRQLLNNLIGNAIKFSAGRPEAPGRVALRVEPQDGGIRFSVSDNGIGMDEATIGRLFRPFTQAEVSTTRRYGGTGLGLAICRRLVEMQGGRIEVQSRPGVGSTFSLWLPLPATPEQPLPEAPQLAGLDCVIVEDADLPADDLQVWLEHAGARVQRAPAAAAGAQAARMLRAPVVLIQADRAATRAPLPEEAGAGLRHLMLARGRRGPPRRVAPHTVTLDLLRHAHFIQGVALAAGRAEPDTAAARAPQPLAEHGPVPTVDVARDRGQLILVAEDDPTNRTVIRRQLALLGYAAEVAEDGQQALALWRAGGHALLLTDLNMPGMDGQALARAIRTEEAAGGRLRLPIIALTAHVMRGETTPSREAGIDDHLSKPVPMRQLQAVLNRWLDNRTAPPATAACATPEAPAALPVLDLAVLHQLVGDDDETVRELLCDFLESAATQAQDLVIALQAGDLRHVAAIAHKLKSASRSVGALVLGELCAALELQADASDPAAARAQLALFESHFATTIGHIETALGALQA